jgi:hypothetical protein
MTLREVGNRSMLGKPIKAVTTIRGQEILVRVKWGRIESATCGDLTWRCG